MQRVGVHVALHASDDFHAHMTYVAQETPWHVIRGHDTIDCDIYT